jgi:hypothetical protein
VTTTVPASAAEPQTGAETEDGDLLNEYGAPADPDDPFLEASEAVEDADVDGRSVSLFEGDEGTLTLDQRRCLVFLMKHRYVSAELHPAEWRVLMDALVPLRSRLNDLFLDLHVDRTARIAFKRRAVPEGVGRFPTLLRDEAYGREETILLIFVRQRFRSDRADGADIVLIDRKDLLDAVARFRPPDANDHANDARRAKNAIDTLRRAGILIGTADAERLRIAPVIEVLLPVTRLREIERVLRALNGQLPDQADQPAHAQALALDLTADANDAGTDLNDDLGWIAAGDEDETVDQAVSDAAVGPGGRA